MTDEKYVLDQTNRERKTLQRCSRAKKNGSRSKYCSLPSDKLTAKERKELNGKVETINITKVMTWEEFRSLSKGLKEEYLKALYLTHQARTQDIADMFGIAFKSFMNALKRMGIDNTRWSMDSKQWHKRSPSEEWRSFILTNSASDSEPVAPDVSLPSEDTNVAPEPSPAVKLYGPEPSTLKPIKLEVVSGSINYIGDPYAVFEKALLAIDPSKEYHFQIRFKEVTE